VLYLVFNLGETGYALATDRIIQVLPCISPRPIRGAPAVVAGAISYQGRYLPVVDLVRLEAGRPAALRMGTRIIVTEPAMGERTNIVGLMVESATQTIRCSPEAFKPFAPSPRGPVQLLDLDNLLPGDLFEGLALELDS